MTTVAAAPRTNDLRVRALELLPTPAAIRTEAPLDDDGAALVASSRRGASDILRGADDRLLVVVGPCSIHDPEAALAYAARLAPLRERFADSLEVVMRVYFEKPRTTLGWKGLINDPGLDGSHDVPRGLRLARRVLLDVVAAGLPAATEFLEPTTPQYVADAVSWGAIGARTPESQVHRQLASGLSMPIGFKNATDGDVQAAIDGCVAAAAEHTFLGIDDDGRASAVATTGNPDGHVVLRGGRSGPNFDAASVAAALDLIGAAGLPRRLVVDASHGNSGKDHVRQAGVVRELAQRIGAGERGIAGVMIESFLVPGRQEPAPTGLVFGQSVTDACVGWDETEELLAALAVASASRRLSA
ncbi:phospho-2-dehydro-3-deoxyheptonate aldolase [Beutenbergia cavernae DSM 12333]|uniref:Phospho-2-dehydro-3-deoxyheptonate aldolase n=1 Tax=Beutenbergia cavernae (strain ATCC BAA-8 / DSM 12333 / CCUG 43141 / JCM 11478 / NBRC 16432 / NCIMB 13614 / HKI 0122) TaxID=471853 RepID=C5BXU5_BEUC1|nr:3-deoxy-7-phosphoheptulonate synthase [Beutenbergia cavernae]ACQ78839.1 phospho-2-dehydro-3-deoxyheptonate aldolase [Beutenbergia cavernae DSM 12333]